MRNWTVATLLALMSWGLVSGQTRPQRPISQVQVARQFLLAVLRGDYKSAYGRLAPEVRQGMSITRFQAAARPLYARGQQRGTAIELYKLGFFLMETGGSKGFVAFSFPADSMLKHPPEWLEVTFRDTTTRQVLGFQLYRPKR
ncbi:hypothetical protein GCM10023185_04500 [Hymenobacter saemangeumensis]|uniref:DUF3887 domain-containing protein n=1 Tax=Hymenobacter saemangeumensis TaxID=1084522 RepID=A0ABP8I073_9BACT